MLSTPGGRPALAQSSPSIAAVTPTTPTEKRQALVVSTTQVLLNSILDRIESELHQRGVGRVAGRVKEDGVAVRCCARRHLGGDRGVRAAAVLDDYRLPHVLGQLLRECASDDVVGAAGHEADQKADRLVRIRLGRRRGCEQ